MFMYYLVMGDIEIVYYNSHPLTFHSQDVPKWSTVVGTDHHSDEIATTTNSLAGIKMCM